MRKLNSFSRNIDSQLLPCHEQRDCVRYRGKDSEFHNFLLFVHVKILKLSHSNVMYLVRHFRVRWNCWYGRHIFSIIDNAKWGSALLSPCPSSHTSSRLKSAVKRRTFFASCRVFSPSSCLCTDIDKNAETFLNFPSVCAGVGARWRKKKKSSPKYVFSTARCSFWIV